CLFTSDDQRGCLSGIRLVQCKRHWLIDRCERAVDDVDWARWVGLIVIHGGGQSAVEECEYAADELHRAAASGQVAEIAFQRDHLDIAEQLMNCLRLKLVLIDRAFAVSIDVTDIGGLESSRGEGRFNRLA